MAGYCAEGLRIKRIEAGRGATSSARKIYVETLERVTASSRRNRRKKKRLGW